jgi:hypothetical protein
VLRRRQLRGGAAVSARSRPGAPAAAARRPSDWTPSLSLSRNPSRGLGARVLALRAPGF